MYGKLNKTQAELIKTLFANYGRLGGQSTSEAKRRAGRANVAKARAVRLANMGKAVQS